MDKLWLDIPNTGDLYQASSDGEVRSKDREIIIQRHDGTSFTRRLRGRVLKPWRDANGYRVVYVCHDDLRRAVNVHRLVAAAFHGDEPDHDVNHLDGDKSNNRPENLTWCSKSENMRHALDTRLWAWEREVVGRPVGGGPEVRFASALKASEAMGLGRVSVHMAARGQRPTAGGYQWRYHDAGWHDLPPNYRQLKPRGKNFRPLA